MKPTMDWRIDVVSEEYYNALVGSGYAWEMYPDLPETWAKAKKEILAYQTKVEYCERTRADNYEASSRLDN